MRYNAWDKNPKTPGPHLKIGRPFSERDERKFI
jgi:hypothetical protein